MRCWESAHGLRVPRMLLITARLLFDMITNINCLKTSNVWEVKAHASVKHYGKLKVLEVLLYGSISGLSAKVSLCLPMLLSRVHQLFNA